MTTIFDQHGINHATVALNLELNPRSSDWHRDADTLFLGGPNPRDEDRDELASFGMRKSYNLVFASFDPANPAAGPVGYDVVVTDGMSRSVVLTAGRLWKRDRTSLSVLLFPSMGVAIGLDSKGCMIVGEQRGRYHERGHGLAEECLRARAAGDPGRVPVVAPVGTLMVVMDVKAMVGTFAAAA